MFPSPPPTHAYALLLHTVVSVKSPGTDETPRFLGESSVEAMSMSELAKNIPTKGSSQKPLPVWVPQHTHLDHKESWMLKNWCFWIVVLEKTFESHLDSMEIKPVNLEGNPPWISTGRTDAEAETPILWPPDLKSQLTVKDPDAGKDWKQEEKGMTEDEMIGWHHRLNGREFEQTPGDGEGQGNLVCCSPWGHKELDTT